MVLKYYCDKCRKEIEPSSDKKFYNSFFGFDFDDAFMNKNQVTLCKSCKRDFKMWLRG